MACYTELFLIAFLYSIYLQLNVETLISLKNVLSKVYWIKNHSNHNWMQTQFLSTFYTPAEHYFLQGVWKNAECIAYPVYFRNTQRPCISILCIVILRKQNKIITHGLYGLP